MNFFHMTLLVLMMNETMMKIWNMNLATEQTAMINFVFLAPLRAFVRRQLKNAQNIVISGRLQHDVDP